MKSMLPSFQKAGTDFGGVIYRKWDHADKKYVFIFLSPSPKFDRFTVELAVNPEAEFPFSILPGDKSPRGAARERIRRFSNKKDGWWDLNHSHEPDMKLILEAKDKVFKATSAIPGLVEDAVLQICQAIPVFLQSLEHTSGDTP